MPLISVEAPSISFLISQDADQFLNRKERKMQKTTNEDRVLYISDAAKYGRQDMDALLKEVMFIEGMNFQCKTLDCQP